MLQKPKIIVLDDDPTGSQTLHSCLLLTQWDVATLRLGLTDSSPIFFVLTNTRAIAPETAATTTREVCRNLKIALELENIRDFLVVSRSDSTLRGHYPVETDAIAAELGPFDAHFLVPAFFEGGRFTSSSIHYLIVDGFPTPVHETEFARDSVFGYRTSYLPDYVEEKTHGQILSTAVERFLLPHVRAGSIERLMRLSHNRCCVVDAEIQSDLNHFANDVLIAAARGKRFLFRSAASLLTALAQLPPQPIPAEEMSRYARSDRPGAVIVGSHVRKTTEQLERLLQVPDVTAVEVNVSRLVNDDGSTFRLLLAEILATVQQVFAAGKTPVVFTSRQELTFIDTETRLAFGQVVSSLLMEIVKGLPLEIRFLISKGGITSNDVLSTGLALPAARLLGQILPGCSVAIAPPNHPTFPNLPIVLFPGNVGDAASMTLAYYRLSANSAAIDCVSG